jgi:chorismate-pyruvate lyase
MDRKNSLLWQKLSPAWRVLLLSDGSVTRHLSVLGGKGFVNDDDDDDDDKDVQRAVSLSESNVKVEVTSMKPCARDKSQPEDVVKIKGPLVQREVYLRYEDDTMETTESRRRIRIRILLSCTRARGGTRMRWRSL